MYNPLPGDGDKSFAFPFQCIMLKIVGAWPLAISDPPNAKGYLYYVWSYIIIILVALTCWAQSAFVFHSWGDILTVTECGCTVLMGLHNLLRLIHLSIRRGTLKKLIAEFVENIWISRKGYKEIAIQCEKDTVVLKVISGLLFVLICMYVTIPLFELFNDLNASEKPFPYKMVFPYNANHGLAYAATYILTSLAGFAVVTTLFAQDSLLGFFIAYTCGQFRILHKNIDQLMKRGQINSLDKSQNPVYLCEEDIQRHYNILLTDAVTQHNKIIRFAQHLEYFFSPMILINYTISSFLICLIGFQIAAVKMTMGNLAKLVVYIVSAMSQLFILCMKGDRLIESSLATSWHLYACNWQGEKQHANNINNAGKLKMIMNCSSGLKFTKHLTFAIQRSQKPLCITAFKFSILSLKSFTAILSTSLSYFTLLQTLVEKSE